MEPDAAAQTGADEPHPRPTRLQWWLVVAPLIGLFVAAQVGDAIAPSIVDKHPLWLVALNSRNRNLILTANNVDPVVFFVVATVRLLVSDPLFYLLGYWYGDAAVQWMEHRSRSIGSGMRQLEGWFKYASYPLVAIAPNNFICLLAGSSGMSPPVFLGLNVLGTIGRVLLIMWLGETFEKPIDWVLDFIKDYRWYLTGLSVLVVGVTLWREFRTGTTEVSGLLDLEETQDDGADGAGVAEGE